MMTVENVELGDFEITGLSSFIRNALSLQLANLEIVFNLTFPLQVKANYIDFSVILGDTIPFYGGGTANLNIDLRLEGLIAIGSTEDEIIYIETLLADIFFDSLKVEISSLMGYTGGKTNDVFNRLIEEITPELIYLMKPMVIDGILESILEVVNGFLLPLGLTWTDIVGCLLGIGECPIPLP
ncbi:hypothetical protein L798_08411 [Zootermopsis nevadensis]|uniref:Uncharacterized protein n=2 Tax=Zootermopsis nevadensis TaxID=136037 RepID=A0A067R2K6_ZOONE|nr:hypothetical protein L798_08411 [Zootermopsis nevadensis]